MTHVPVWKRGCALPVEELIRKYLKSMHSLPQPGELCWIKRTSCSGAGAGPQVSCIMLKTTWPSSAVSKFNKRQTEWLSLQRKNSYWPKIVFFSAVIMKEHSRKEEICARIMCRKSLTTFCWIHDLHVVKTVLELPLLSVAGIGSSLPRHWME